MRTKIIGVLVALTALAVAAGCGGSGSTSSPATASPTATPTYVPSGPPSTTAPVGSSAASVTVSAGSTAEPFAATIDFPVASSGSATMTVSASTSVPSTPAGITAYSGSGATPLLYVELTPSATVTFPASSLEFQLTLPAVNTPQNYNFWGALYTNDAGFPAGVNAWSAQFLGAATSSGQTLTFPNPSASLTFTAGDYYVFCLYEVAT
ncbi:MAG TPA: hypothetical protein VMA98_04735 [Candidatus Acidoferrales bacterium]|nr:hypothetical protein [Candidatus Acidoferrales bacterium]